MDRLLLIVDVDFFSTGGHILGKGVSEDFSFSGSSCLTSKGTIPNPHDHTRSAGGSSSGVAVLVSCILFISHVSSST